MADVVCLASWNADLVVRVARPIARGETVFADGFDVQPGGKGSNAAVAAARQGAAVAIVARIGDDDFGRMARSLWQREGIDAAHVASAPGERSGVAQIQVFADGDNAIAVWPGANLGLAASHALAAAGTIAAARVVVASCEVPPDCTIAAFRLARAAGVTTVLNPAPAGTLSAELLGLTDVLTPNEGELTALGARSAPDAAPGDATSGAIDADARRLLARGVGAVLVTLGPRGCRLVTGERADTIAGWNMTVSDTIGAGDTFTGALAAALARGAALPDAARRANAAAALSVTGTGAIGAMPTAADVDALLAGQGSGRPPPEATH